MFNIKIAKLSKHMYTAIMKKVKPLLRGHFHQAMFFVTLGATSILISQSHSLRLAIATSIYSLGALLMFGISALYHRVTWNDSQRAFMKKLDHSAIYIMIAGTCTPITMLAMEEPSSTTLLVSIWVIAAFGLIQSIFFVNLPKYINAIIYIIMGYMIAPYFSELLPRVGMSNIILFSIGGLSYSIGAISYALKRPTLNPKYFSYHEVFHILVNIGAIFHFIVIYSIVKAY